MRHELRTGSSADIDSLEPLWIAVHHQHVASMPELALAESGMDDLVLGVLPGNTAAIRLYERRGYRPTWMYLSRFAGRD